MKIGIQTDLLDIYGYGRWNENMYQKLRDHGYDCTDLPMANTNTPIYDLPIEKAKELVLREKELADNAGIEIFQTHGPWQWPPKDSTPEDRSERMEKMKKAIYFTSLLNCKNIVLHPLMPFGVTDLAQGNKDKTEKINTEFFSELLETASKYHVTICLENTPYPEFSLAKPKDLFEFVKKINHKNPKLCLDTGHAFVFDELNLADEVTAIASELCALHIHDNKLNEDLHLMPYFGNIDWQAFAESLKKAEYDGCFILETMPSRKLPTPIFEEMCISLAKIAKNISEKI